MSGNDDKWPFFHRQRNCCGHRRAKGFGICLIQQCHTGQVHPAKLHAKLYIPFHLPVLFQGKQTLLEKSMNFFISITQHHGMIGISCHAPHAEQQQGFYRTDILCRTPHAFHIIVIGIAAAGLTKGASRCNRCLIPMHAIQQLLQSCIIKIHIGQCGKQSLDDQPICLFRLGIVGTGMCQSNQCTCQLIL